MAEQHLDRWRTGPACIRLSGLPTRASHALSEPAQRIHDLNRRTSSPVLLPESRDVRRHPALLLSPVALGVLALAMALLTLPAQVRAQAVQPEGATAQAAYPLKPSPLLREALPSDAQELAPTFVSGDRMTGQTDALTVIEGDAELRRHNIVIRAERLQFDSSSREVQAQGEVLINTRGDRFEGPQVHINVDTHQGSFTQPSFSLLKNEGKGDASRIDFLDKDRLEAFNGRYSTCPRTPGAAWMPDWLVRATRIELDNQEEVGLAHGGVLEFKGFPILGFPYLSFPLTDKRKSGLLPPTINLDNISGLELTLPYYLNLAPNLDATLYPTLMSKRGVDLGGEFRYLRTDYSGQVRGAYMPSDQLRNEDRWAYSIQHNQRLSSPLTRWPALDAPIGLRLNLNRVSDDNYWRDFPRSSTSLTTRLLASDAVLSTGKGPWSATAGVYQWQTLQDVAAPILPPYDRLPSVAVRYARSDARLAGLDNWAWSVQGELTRFSASPGLGTLGRQNGIRSLAIADISRRWQTPGWFVQPRARLHTAHYALDTALSDGKRSAARAIPSLSLDSGLVLERDTGFFGRDFIQTLEPRAFFTWTPYREQRQLPNYDSAAHDFSLASIYTENAFGGNDRISDTQAVTLGATSRLLDSGNGAEVLSVGLAQRFLQHKQSVILPQANCASTSVAGCSPVTKAASDVLASAHVQWNPHWSMDANVQFRPKENESVRTTLSGRYTPGPYRVLSAAYRLQRGTSEQYDIGWQWPLNDLWQTPARTLLPGRGLGAGQWYSVGRINYSVPDKKIVDLVAGFEYDAGCWLGRLVVERLQRSTATANQRILFQLEFTGFSRIGSNPLQTLRENVPRYQYLREEINPPSRFQQYD
jgi:LPS-assembly protein